MSAASIVVALYIAGLLEPDGLLWLAATQAVVVALAYIAPVPGGGFSNTEPAPRLQKSRAPWPAGATFCDQDPSQEFKLPEAIQGGEAQGGKQIVHGLWEQVGAQATSIAGGEWTQAIASAAPATGKTNAEIEPRNRR